ncbi:hypothetical protein A3J90_08640 [candidate division WOR-1 bacterium RIFOXYC2_FULL_37_10]|uniref:ABC transporter domain-containing protein n=1 Tax=candidate division WOR-1 bacterium RIFOXYB2_FULL_37_13 TaxID=1802579 RepID=A0A1F4SNI3_UNCSA|nr:MAG: hypothetical protein A2246_06845 [candidate division WOR-1 bacterium RIFOXYA2_FULL_37_7]OGC22014.1 MAG: hypothetical protein A2310_06920 [candidate division WOR-1 bacterium RIFOXYB2_FULL_37_13]OGC33042.1 MAG: hypothetical protein A3J90_08640 [candidate division WOR-1 bacterium RIFOXYC2_FULL_37_10]
MLQVKTLSTLFYKDDSIIKAVDDFSFYIEKGETLGLLGESGSGKSTVALSILRLISKPGKIVSGAIELDGQDILKLSDKEIINIRGAKLSMIFQDPFSSLNPVFTIGDQIAETISLHQKLSKKESWRKAKEMLQKVQIDPDRIRNYPHQFSGGMRQRVMIAMALSCQPEFLIADEPTTALDVTIQEGVLKLIKDLQRELGFGMIFITHNFRIAKKVCDRFCVMQKGKLVEEGSQVFNKPQKPYTKKLVDCMNLLYA